jgi:cytochrome c-type biogenesis protein CcmH
MRYRLATFLLAALVSIIAAGTLVQAAVACTPQTNLPDVEDEVMCTICGTLLAESDSPQAERERALIRQKITACESKDQIKDALVAEYGPRVLATPSGHGFDLLAWLVPGAGILLVLALGGFALLRQRSRRRDEPVPPEPEIAQADLTRLDRDMSSYDL